MNDDSATRDHTTLGPLGTWGPLHLIQEVGRGGFGVVYRAWEPVLAREVALKIIKPGETRVDALNEVLREGQLLARVNHPNVVTIYGAQRVGDEVGLWMRFVRGRSLADLVTRDGPLASSEAAVIGISLCQAVAAVHHAGVIHRDIKAQNVMRESGGRIVLMDFGAGQVLRERGARSEYIIGTPAYMAPEVLLGSRASAVSDVYSLGVLLFYLVTGSYPVEGRTWSDFTLAHSRAARRRLADVRPDLDAHFIRIVERATAPQPEERFQSPGALLAALTQIAAQVPPARLEADAEVVIHPVDRDAAKPVVKIDRRLVVVAAGALGIWLLGTITSVIFNFTLGRAGEFNTESVTSWWIWGFRALIPGTVHVVIVLLAWWAITAAIKVLMRAAPPVGRALQSGTTYLRTLSHRRGIDDPGTLGQLMLVLQVLAIAVYCWYFSDVFSAMTSFLGTAASHDLEPLRPHHVFRHQMYNYSMAMLILGMGAAVLLLRRMRRVRGGTEGMSLYANYAVIGIAFVILVLPYRLMWHNDLEVAFYQNLRCYALAENGPSVLLYCPASDVPRTKKVSQLDPALRRSGRFENLYTRPALPAS